MGKPQRRRGGTNKNKFNSRLMKGKHYRRDMDLIYEDIQDRNMDRIKRKMDGDQDLAGMGKFYCTHCAKHCISKKAYNDHIVSKPHKRRLKVLKEKPYDHKEAELLNR